MKKVIYILAILFVAIQTNYAQRVDIDKFFFSLKTRHLPYKVLAPDYKTYAVRISSSVAVEAYTNESFSNRISIVGLKRESGLGHLNVAVRFDDLLIESSDVKERVEVLKDKDGKETGRRYYYHAEVVYSFAASASVTDYKTQAALSSIGLARRDDKKAYSSSEYDSYKKAADFYNNNRLEIKTSLIKEQIEGALASLNSSLNNDFGYSPENNSPHVWYVDSKKHPEYQASQDACNTVKTVFSQVVAEDSLRGIKEGLKGVISYFEQLPAKYADLEEKAHKKVRYMAYYNLGVIYYFLDEPEVALTYAQKIVENDYDTSDGKTITKHSNALIEAFKKHNMHSRHFPIDLSGVEAPKL